MAKSASGAKAPITFLVLACLLIVDLVELATSEATASRLVAVVA